MYIAPPTLLLNTSSKDAAMLYTVPSTAEPYLHKISQNSHASSSFVLTPQSTSFHHHLIIFQIATLSRSPLRHFFQQDDTSDEPPWTHLIVSSDRRHRFTFLSFLRFFEMKGFSASTSNRSREDGYVQMLELLPKSYGPLWCVFCISIKSRCVLALMACYAMFGFNETNRCRRHQLMVVNSIGTHRAFLNQVLFLPRFIMTRGRLLRLIWRTHTANTQMPETKAKKKKKSKHDSASGDEVKETKSEEVKKPVDDLEVNESKKKPKDKKKKKERTGGMC
ncbi:hypothetical protein SSX86_012811 [Deinandra increscens subsp. villosa]|uniref:Uncharacterized protein n=1 Tax=Deinandra increscens subsp. villosa TaxID=3103831 RepID=A0AAP0D4Y4_9ASTR